MLVKTLSFCNNDYLLVPKDQVSLKCPFFKLHFVVHFVRYIVYLSYICIMKLGM